MGSTQRKPQVVVTGASSGIGNALALALNAAGWSVIATYRHPADGAKLSAVGNGLKAVALDISQGDSIAAFTRSVEAVAITHGLDGLVNNAGMVVAGPLEVIPLEVIREQFEVNVIGHLAVTQALLPLLRQAKGRIVNIGSISGQVSTPYFGPYAASKFALTAMTDALRMELRPFGVKVSIVDPGNTSTPIWEKATRTADSIQVQADPVIFALYEQAIQCVMKAAKKMESSSGPTDAVCAAVIHALTHRRPKPRYVVGWDAVVASLACRFLPTRLLDFLRLKQLGLPFSDNQKSDRLPP